ncbi:hypothetical protein ACFY2M_19545 [Streptomyces sp. NPDC001276]|uniref:hypothetical protein n=1 Tax=Streptomyces sp. NPDC001276 TaxID=3364555 RepID=UPI00367776FC
MTADTVALYLAAGRHLHPWLDWAVWFVLWTLPGFLFVAALYVLVGACQRLAALVRRYRTRHHLPAATDNTPGTNPELLRDCRRILTASTDQPARPRKETP